MTTIARIPFAAMLAIIVALVLAIDVFGALAHWGDRTLFLLVIPAGLAAWFLIEYRRLPFAVPEATTRASTPAESMLTSGRESPSPAPPRDPAVIPPGVVAEKGPAGDFEDPVEEADRIETETRRERSSDTAPADSPGHEPPVS